MKIGEVIIPAQRVVVGYSNAAVVPSVCPCVYPSVLLILDQQWLPNKSDFPPISWYRAWPTPIMSGFHGAFAIGVTCQQGTLTTPDTWFRPLLRGLACALIVETSFPDSSSIKWPTKVDFYRIERFPWSICDRCGMSAGSGHLVPSPIVRLACAPIVETRFLELAMSLLDFSPRIPLGTFSIFLLMYLAEKDTTCERSWVLNPYQFPSKAIKHFENVKVYRQTLHNDKSSLEPSAEVSLRYRIPQVGKVELCSATNWRDFIFFLVTSFKPRY